MASAIPHLSFPSKEDPEPIPSSSATTLDAPRVLHSDKLYIGNLHPTVDEHSLLKLLRPFGTITALDFLFHTSGPQKGTPRGYAFVKFSKPEEAQKARERMEGKLVRGRRVVVGYAHQLDAADNGKPKKPVVRSVNKEMTMLSLLKGTSQPGQRAGRNKGLHNQTQAQIRALEAKLQQMDQSTDTVQVTRHVHPLPPRPQLTATPALTFEDIMEASNEAPSATLDSPVLDNPESVDAKEKSRPPPPPVKKGVIKGIKIVKKITKAGS